MSDDSSVPYVIEVNMTDVLNSDTLKIFSILIEPKLHKTVKSVLEKLKGLFNLNKNIQFVNKLSYIPEMETANILYYLKGVRAVFIDSEFPINGVAATDEIVGPEENVKDVNSSRTSILENGLPKKQELGSSEALNSHNCPSPQFEEKQVCTSEVKTQRTWVRSFSLGDFLTDFRNDHKEPLDNSIASVDEDDKCKRRRRSRRRKKRDSIPDENEQDEPTPKYSKPYSFETTSHEEAKHLRFTDDEIAGDKGAIQEAVEKAESRPDPDAAVAKISNGTETQLAALFSLKADAGGPMVFMRTPPA